MALVQNSDNSEIKAILSYWSRLFHFNVPSAIYVEQHMIWYHDKQTIGY